MAECLALMEESGLNLFGRELGPATVDAYLAVLHSRGAELIELGLMRRAAIRHAGEGGDFPSAAEFADSVRMAWESDRTCIGVFQTDGSVSVRWITHSEAAALGRPAEAAVMPMPELPDMRWPSVQVDEDRARRQIDALLEGE